MGAAASAFVGCAGAPAHSQAPRLAVHVAAAGVDEVLVEDLPAADLSALARVKWTPAQWQAVLRVTSGESGAGPSLPPVAGLYHVDGGRLRFVPAFPLDPELSHVAQFDPAQVPDGEGRHAVGHVASTGSDSTDARRTARLTLRIPATRTPAPPSTHVLAVEPANVLLENQLRIYIHFSAPMGTRGVQEHVRLRDEGGAVVDGAFLPLDLGLWDPGRRRYTLLFDPGRVKRGILPNMQLGRPLRAGRRYTLEIDAAWRDGQGATLAAPFRRTFTVAPAVVEPLVPSDWRLTLPAPGTRAALAVQFPRPLDPALVARTFFVLDAAGRVLEGHGVVEPAASGWSFTPAVPWTTGAYQVGASPELEDQAGNRVGRPFDYDPTHPGRAGLGGRDTHTEARVPFTLR